jgi:hypothetical protein
VVNSKFIEFCLRLEAFFTKAREILVEIREGLFGDR